MSNLYVKKIGVTNNSDFKDYARIGEDYLFQRWESVNAVIDQFVAEEYRCFLARPVFDEETDTVSWYTKEWHEETSPVQIGKLSGDLMEKYYATFSNTLAYYKDVVSKLPHMSDGYKILNRAIQNLDAPNYVNNFVFAVDDRVVCVAWGMSLLEKNKNRIDSIIMGIPKPPIKKYSIRFSAGEHASLDGHSNMRKPKGYTILSTDIPVVHVEEGYDFLGWDMEPLNHIVSGDRTFIAQTSEHKISEHVPPTPPTPSDDDITICFNGGDHGTLVGVTSLSKKAPYTLSSDEIPEVSPVSGYEFIGWDLDPTKSVLSQDQIFTAQYRRTPWYKRFGLWLLGILAALWHWLTKSGWKWLLFILLLILLSLLLSKCSHGKFSSIFPSGCSHKQSSVIDADDRSWIEGDDRVRLGEGGIYDPGNPYQEAPDPAAPGSGYEDLEPILPGRPNRIQPIEGEPEIIPGDPSNPSNPPIIGNRLNLLMENEEKSVLDLIRAFKAEYPSDQYKVVYYDDVIKRVQIEIPSAERETLKRTLPSQFSEYQIFVFDEALFEGAYVPNDPAVNYEQKWYLDAIEAFDAWDITRGSEGVTVAIVDNGFTLSHPEFQGKIVMPYNVWTHDAHICAQEVDHGTHVAGIAIGNADNNKGISGIAPLCKFMPIQVADNNGLMTTTSVMDGIIYALYQGADVINVSLGQPFAGLDNYPEEIQRQLIDNRFKEEERLWREIMRIAQRHNNATIVVAAGNDNVLAGIDALQRPDLFVTVSAVDKTSSPMCKAGFSNYGEYSTVSAPGVDIFSSYKDGYESMPGTSMAAPIVTGTIALMKSVKKDITNQQIICTLQSTGKPVRDNIGNLVQINKALKRIKSGDIDDCTPEPSSGDVQILLSWNNYNDLDLQCIDPNNDMVSYRQKRVPSGGRLEIDMNVNDHHSNHPIENIFWPENGAPAGTYHVGLVYFHQHEQNINQTPYKIIVRYGGKEETYEGTITYNAHKQPLDICSFTLGNGTPSQSHIDEPNREAERRRIKQQLERRRNELQRELQDVNDQLSNL